MIIGIDIGSFKICTVVGEVLPGGGARVIGMGHAPAGGIRAGEIVHIEEAAGAIAASVERAERGSGVKIDRALVGITGPSIRGANNHGVLPFGRRPRPITRDDIDRALDVAGNVPLASDRTVLHVLPRFYVVDGGAPVDNPIDMEGQRLEAHVHIVTAATSAVANLRRCLDMAEVVPTGLVMSTLAAAEAVLTPDERDLGAFVVDLGGAVTSVTCYHEGALAHTAALPVGGRHMTNDLSVVLQTPLAEAERLKAAHGHVLPELDDDTTEIEVVPFGDEDRRATTRLHVSEILAARADQIAEMVNDDLDGAGFAGKLPAGAVMIGGGAELAGLPKRLGARWAVPTRVGKPTGLLGLADAVRGPAHAGAVGLLHWGSASADDRASPLTLPVDAGTGMAKLVEWVKAAFLPSGGSR